MFSAGYPLALLGRAIPAQTLVLDTDSIGQFNDSLGRVFRPGVACGIEELCERPGWPGWVPDVRFSGSIDNSELSPRGRLFHNIVSGRTMAESLAALPAKMGAILRPPTFWAFFLGANDLAAGTAQAAILADYETACASVWTYYAGATLPVIITPKDDLAAFPITAQIQALRAAVLAGGVPSARRIVDLSAFPQSALAADGVHSRGPDGGTVPSVYRNQVARSVYGYKWIAWAIVTQLLRPGVPVPLYPGE